MVFVSERISVKYHLLLLLLRFQNTCCLHMWLELSALRVAIDQRNFTLDLGWLAREDELSKVLGLLIFATLLDKVLNDH